MHLPLKSADGAVYTVESQVVLALNHAKILGTPFLHKFNHSVNCKAHTIIY